MKIFRSTCTTLVVCALALCAGTRLRAQTASPEVRREIIDVRNQWMAAEMKKDIPYLDGLMAPEFVVGNSQGQVMDKAHYLESQARPDRILHPRAGIVPIPRQRLGRKVCQWDKQPRKRRSSIRWSGLRNPRGSTSQGSQRRSGNGSPGRTHRPRRNRGAADTRRIRCSMRWADKCYRRRCSARRLSSRPSQQIPRKSVQPRNCSSPPSLLQSRRSNSMKRCPAEPLRWR